MSQPKTLWIYYNTSRKEFSLDEAMAELKRHKSFTVFLQFLDPRTDCLVQKNFVFYPKPHVWHSGSWFNRCFVTDDAGLSLRIPADLSWWAEHQGKGSYVGRYKTSIFSEGDYVDVEFDLLFDPVIRVDADEPDTQPEAGAA